VAIKKKDTRTKLAFGDLNQIEKPNTGVSYDASDTTVMGTLQTMLGNLYNNKGFESVGLLKGIVLRVETASDKSANSVWSSLFGFNTTPLREIKVRIPEVHAALPEPAVYGDTPGPHQRIIDLYPTFVARDEVASKEDITPGDIVIVDYADKNNLTQPIFIKKVTQGPGASGEKSKNGINQDSQSSEGSEAFNNDKGGSGYCGAGATGPGNGRVLASSSGASKLERAQNVVAMIQSQTGVSLSVRLLFSFMEVESCGRTPTKTTVRFEPHVFLGMRGPTRKTGKKGSRPDLYGGSNYSGNAKVPYSPRGNDSDSWSNDPHNKRKSLRGRDYFIDSNRGNTNRAAFDRAFKLDPVQAIKATSWGSYQVMGWALLRAYDNDPHKAIASYDSNPEVAGDMMIVVWFKDNFRSARKKQAFSQNPPAFEEMVKIYNGKAQVRTYAPKLQSAYNKYGDIPEPNPSSPADASPTLATNATDCGENRTT